MIRLWPRHHMFAADLAELLEVLRECPRACDEVWFCTYWGFPTLEVHREHARMISEAAEQVRALGIRAGMQIANTLGHGASPFLPEDGANWPLMMNDAGQTEVPFPCPRSPEVLQYIDQMSRSYATVQPSSVWIDDDLRISPRGPIIRNSCFCETCLDDFSRERGVTYTREKLREELAESAAGGLRLAWTKFAGESLGAIARTIARAFHEVSPSTRLAQQQLEHENFMNCGPDWSPIHDSLAQETQQPTGARLGNGFYTDHNPRQMIWKGLVINRQISRLPKTVRQICPEIDNFTHNRFGKSLHGTVVEGSLYFAMGCNSVSYAILCSAHESHEYYRLLLGKIASYRPFWESYVEASRESFHAGIEVPLSPHHVTRPLAAGEEPYAWTRAELNPIYQLAPLGLPLCGVSAKASGAILSSEVVPGLSDEELKKILSGGVMMNGSAAKLIQDRGLGDLLGVRVTKIKHVDVYERMTTDPLNGLYAGKSWMLWLDVASSAYLLEPLQDSVRALGEYRKPDNASAGIATSLAENSLGGRVAVFGYYDWVTDPSTARRNQYLAAADWISREQLPVISRTLAQVMVVPRVDAEGKLVSIFVLNASIEPVDSLDLECRNLCGSTARWITPEGDKLTLDLASGSSLARYRTPSLAAWSCAYIDFV